MDSAAAALVEHTVSEAVGAHAAPEVCEEVMRLALAKAQRPDLPGVGADVASFIEGPLHDAVVELLGDEPAEAIRLELAPMAAMMMADEISVVRPRTPIHAFDLPKREDPPPSSPFGDLPPVTPVAGLPMGIAGDDIPDELDEDEHPMPTDGETQPGAAVPPVIAVFGRTSSREPDPEPHQERLPLGRIPSYKPKMEKEKPTPVRRPLHAPIDEPLENFVSSLDDNENTVDDTVDNIVDNIVDNALDKIIEPYSTVSSTPAPKASFVPVADDEDDGDFPELFIESSSIAAAPQQTKSKLTPPRSSGDFWGSGKFLDSDEYISKQSDDFRASLEAETELELPERQPWESKKTEPPPPPGVTPSDKQSGTTDPGMQAVTGGAPHIPEPSIPNKKRPPRSIKHTDPAPDALPLLLVASSDPARVDALNRAMSAVATIEPIRDALAVLEMLGADPTRIVVVDCGHPTIRLETLIALAPELPAESRLVLWGEQFLLPQSLAVLGATLPEGWLCCGDGATADDVAAVCSVLLS